VNAIPTGAHSRGLEISARAKLQPVGDPARTALGGQPFVNNSAGRGLFSWIGSLGVNSGRAFTRL
jgi:hypothetical protein